MSARLQVLSTFDLGSHHHRLPSLVEVACSLITNQWRCCPNSSIPSREAHGPQQYVQR